MRELEEVPGEELAIKARKEIDKLRSLQLWAELRVLREAVEALQESQREAGSQTAQALWRLIARQSPRYIFHCNGHEKAGISLGELGLFIHQPSSPWPTILSGLGEDEGS